MAVVPTINQDPMRGTDSITSWYDCSRPMWIDLVGDYAGKELFLVEGDSLLRECFEDGRIDFNYKIPNPSPAQALSPAFDQTCFWCYKYLISSLLKPWHIGSNLEQLTFGRDDEIPIKRADNQHLALRITRSNPFWATPC